MRLKLQILLLMIILALLLGVSPAVAAEKNYVLSYSPGTLFHQLVRDRTKMVYARAGLKAEFIPLPHNRSLLSANDGTVDGDVGRVPSIEEKYPNLRRVDAKLMDLNGAVYTVNPEIDRYDESLLTQYRVGYVLGVRWAQKKMEGLKATTAHNYQALFEMLMQGRVDIVLATEASADAIMHEFGGRAEKISKLQPFVITAPIYHYVNKKNADVISLLETTVNEINKEGVFAFYAGFQSPLFEILQKRLQEAFRRIGKTCEVRSTGSSQRALVLANEKGDGDALRISAIKKIAPDMTANLLQIPESIFAIEFHVYTKGESFSVDGWDSLQGRHNGLRVGTKVLEENIPGQRTRLPDSERLLRMLAEGRIDTVSEHSLIVDFIVQKLELPGIKKLSPALVAYPGYSYIHKKHKELIPALAASLAEMKADGSFEQIEKDVFNKLLAN